MPGDRQDAFGVRDVVASYDVGAPALVPEYESLSFEDIHAAVLDLLPDSAGCILDVGAGTGRDAAWFAANGHNVVAVEPSARFRAAANSTHCTRAMPCATACGPKTSPQSSRRRPHVDAESDHTPADRRRRAVGSSSGSARLPCSGERCGPRPRWRRSVRAKPEPSSPAAPPAATPDSSALRCRSGIRNPWRVPYSSSACRSTVLAACWRLPSTVVQILHGLCSTQICDREIFDRGPPKGFDRQRGICAGGGNGDDDRGCLTGGLPA